MGDFLSETTLIAIGWSIVACVVAIFAAKLLQSVLVRLLCSKFIFRSDVTRCILSKAQRPLLWLLIFMALSAAIPATAIPATAIPEPQLTYIALILRPLAVACLGWLVIAIARGIGEWLETHNATQRDALGSRRFTTQIRILMRIVITVIVVLTIIGMAMVIPAMRQLGMSMFASAGVAGIVIGVAAKETLSNLIAGAQLALTQQILLGDDVVVSGQTGKIEEITSSYVVLKTWDLRRIVIPLRFFMENSFENLTYKESDLFGPVFLYVDYSVDMKGLRAEVDRVVKQSKHWDGKRCELLATDSKEATLLLRVAVSAKDSGTLWALQCETREKLVDYLQREQPSALPKTRGEQKPIESWDDDARGIPPRFAQLKQA